MLRGLIICLLGWVLLPLSEAFATPVREVCLLAARFATGFGLALYFVNSKPFVMAIASPEERSYVFSLGGAFRPLGGFLGAIVAGVLPAFFASALGTTLENPQPYRYPLVLVSIVLVPAVWAVGSTQQTIPPSAEQEPLDAPRHSRLPLALIVSLSLVMLLRGAGVAAMRTFFNVYLDTILLVPTSVIGSLSSAGSLLGVLFALATPLLVSRWGNEGTYIIASLAMAACMFLLALVPKLGAAGLSSMGISALSAITIPPMTVFQMEVMAPEWRTTMSGAGSMAMGVSRSIMALIGGFAVASMGYPFLFFAGAGLMIAGAALFWSRHARQLLSKGPHREAN